MAASSIDKAIGNILKERMKASANLKTDEQVGLKVGLGKSTIDRYKRGDNNMPVANLVLLAGAFKMRGWQLLKMAEERVKPARAGDPGWEPGAEQRQEIEQSVLEFASTLTDKQAATLAKVMALRLNADR